MGLQDRAYYQQEQHYRPSGGGGMTLGLPPITPMVKWLLIINLGAFVTQLATSGWVEEWFGATGQPRWAALQVWRLLTFQFLHSRHSVLHILFNMIGLYFLGGLLERTWGSIRFLKFYLTCGVVGGAVFVLASMAGAFGPAVLIGASGGVLGLVGACAILFPHVRVFIFLFPVPIRVAAVLFTFLYVFNVVTGGHNAGGDLCHLGGMATGVVWVLGRPYFGRFKQRLGEQSRQKATNQQWQDEQEIDRILEKVSREGLHGLTRREKDTLRRATEAQKRRDQSGWR